MRRLIYVPILHTEADLGSFAGDVQAKLREAIGDEAMRERASAIDVMWEGLRRKLLDSPLDWRRVRVYQDGLPICGREHDIVRDMAAAGSKNHRILVELVERGATLMGTEDPQLVVREYRRIQRLVEASRAGASEEVLAGIVREGDAILAARDDQMAARIDSTLAEGETGVLFLGLLHRVDERLDGKFQVFHLIHSLPFGADLLQRLRERRGQDA